MELDQEVVLVMMDSEALDLFLKTLKFLHPSRTQSSQIQPTSKSLKHSPALTDPHVANKENVDTRRDTLKLTVIFVSPSGLTLAFSISAMTSQTLTLRE